MKHPINAACVLVVLGITPALADANKSFIELTAKIHQMMTDVLLANQYCPKLKADLEAMNTEILKIAGNGAPDMIKDFSETVQGRVYLEDQTKHFKGIGRDAACEWARLEPDSQI